MTNRHSYHWIAAIHGLVAALGLAAGAQRASAQAADFESSIVASDQRAILLRSKPHGAAGTPVAALPVDAGGESLRTARVLFESPAARQIEATWRQLHRWAPADAQNLVDGQGTKRTDLGVAFSEPVQIDTVILDALGQHVYGRNKVGLRDYALKCRTADGKWLVVASVKNNTRQYLIHQFPPMEVIEIAVDRNSVHCYQEDARWAKPYYGARRPREKYADGLRSIAAYIVGSDSRFGVETRSQVVTIEKSPKGRIAIFKDDVPMPEGVASSSDYLDEVLRNADYRVTFLNAELLSNTPLLSKENFDLFVHPYGCSFPMGTTLYDFLEQGGHLVSIGGKAMTNALERTVDGKLAASGYDPGLITTPETMLWINWYEPYTEQLGMFAGPWQRFLHVDSTCTVKDQQVIDPAICIKGALEGYPSTGVVGETVSLDDEQRYVREGKEPPYILAARRGAKESGDRTLGKMHRLDADENYDTFKKPVSRWVQLLATYDRYGRPRGSAGAMMLNHDGPYPGSIWTFFGVTNRDLFAPDDKTMAKALVDIVDFSLRSVFLHGLGTGYACYRQGEKVSAKVFVANFGAANRSARVTFDLLPLDGERIVFTQRQTVELPKGESTKVEMTWAPEHFELDFYRVRCTLTLDGKPVDRMENGFVVWNEQAFQANSAFRVNYHDNYFHDGARPLFVLGSRTEGQHRAGQHGEGPLDWERRCQQMQDSGMSVYSPIFLQMYVPGFAWGAPLPELVPEVVLRQLDAQAALCQQHKLIYAPCLFFEYRHDCLVKQDLSERIAKLLGDRYCRVPGFVFYLWDDVWCLDGTPAEQFLDLSRRCLDAVNSNPVGREYYMLCEHYASENLCMRRTQRHLTIGHNAFYNRFCDSVAGLVAPRLADLRAAGKSQGCGEFYLPAGELRHEEDSYHTFFVQFPHTFFGLGYSWILNWKWSDSDYFVFPKGMAFACDRIRKNVAYPYRNLSLFLRSFRPQYVQPEAMFVLPNAYWEKNRPPRETQDAPGEEYEKADLKAPAEIDGELQAVLGKIMAAGYVNIGVVDEFDLERLAPTTRALIYPYPVCLHDKTYQWLLSFVRRGGHLYIAGDMSYAVDEKRRCPERLAELAGVEFTDRLTATVVPHSLRALGHTTVIKPAKRLGDWQQPYDGRVDLRLRAGGADVLATDAQGDPVLVGHNLGKGRVVFNADLSHNAPSALYEAFLQQAGVARQRTNPDDPQKIPVVRVPTLDGAVYGVGAGVKGEITITSAPIPVTLKLTRWPMAMAAFDHDGRVTACESDGMLKVDGKTIIEANASLQVFTLDRKPIDGSEAVVVLPQPFKASEITIRTAPTVDSLVLGDVFDGKWKTCKQIPLRADADKVRFTIDDVDSTYVILLTAESTRDKYARMLSRFMEGYLDDR